MRQEDKDEIWHLARIKPLDALLLSFDHAKNNETALLDGKVVMIFGTGDQGDGFGCPWMLASDLLKEVRKPFLRESHLALSRMSEGFHTLHNVVWSKNREHVRWLRWLGFSFLPAVPMGPDGELFYPFFKVN